MVAAKEEWMQRKKNDRGQNEWLQPKTEWLQPDKDWQQPGKEWLQSGKE